MLLKKHRRALLCLKFNETKTYNKLIMKYIYNEKPIFLLIDNFLFEALEGLIEKNNQLHPKGKFKLKMDFAVYILDTISRKSTQKKSKYVRLKAKYLKDLQGNYNFYIDFLLQSKLLKRLPYNVNTSKCFGYRIIYPKPNLPARKRRFIKYEPLSFTFKKKLAKHFDNRKSTADKSTGHLTKWLNSDFISLDYDSAIDYIHNSKLTNNQLYHRRYLCEILKEDIWYYSREGKDNRLHSNLTSFPWDLKPFLSNKVKKLISQDLKSSQPFLLAGLLNLIVNKEYEKLEYILNNMIVDKVRKSKLESTLSIMIPKSLEPSTSKELIEFIKLIEKTDIYDYIGSQFSDKLLKNVKVKDGFEDLFYNENLGYKVKTKFNDLRDYAKRVMLEYMYCSPKSSEARYKELRAVFPNTLNEFVDTLKETNIKLGYTKNDFAIILQNIESYVFLDVVSKEFSVKYPNTFVATIHDSLIVPIGFENKVKRLLKNNLFNIFKLNATVKNDVW